MGWQADDVVRSHLQAARAFIFAAHEDFGISPVEAQDVVAVGFGEPEAIGQPKPAAVVDAGGKSARFRAMDEARRGSIDIAT